MYLPGSQRVRVRTIVAQQYDRCDVPAEPDRDARQTVNGGVEGDGIVLAALTTANRPRRPTVGECDIRGGDGGRTFGVGKASGGESLERSDRGRGAWEVVGQQSKVEGVLLGRERQRG